MPLFRNVFRSTTSMASLRISSWRNHELADAIIKGVNNIQGKPESVTTAINVDIGLLNAKIARAKIRIEHRKRYPSCCGVIQNSRNKKDRQTNVAAQKIVNFLTADLNKLNSATSPEEILNETNTNDKNHTLGGGSDTTFDPNNQDNSTDVALVDQNENLPPSPNEIPPAINFGSNSDGINSDPTNSQIVFGTSNQALLLNPNASEQVNDLADDATDLIDLNSNSIRNGESEVEDNNSDNEEPQPLTTEIDQTSRNYDDEAHAPSNGPPIPSRSSISESNSDQTQTSDTTLNTCYMEQLLKLGLNNYNNYCIEFCLLYLSQYFSIPLPDFNPAKYLNHNQIDIFEIIDTASEDQRIPAEKAQYNLSSNHIQDPESFLSFLLSLDKNVPHLVRTGVAGRSGHYLVLEHHDNEWRVYSNTESSQVTRITNNSGQVLEHAAMDIFHIEELLQDNNLHHQFVLVQIPVTIDLINLLNFQIKKLRYNQAISPA